MKTARNAPCPCGSGRKFKLCYGTTRAQEHEVERLLTAVEKVAGVATAFPRLRPSGAAFSAWADRAAEDPEGAIVGEGLALLAGKDWKRLARACGRELQPVWQSFCDDLGDEKLAFEAVVSGAVVGAVRERVGPDSQRLELLEGSGGQREDPCEALAIALECGDLWSLRESIETDAALAALPEELDDKEYEERWEETVAAQAARLTMRWHRKQLAALVRRLRSRLPLPGYPGASATLASACEMFERERGFRARLAAELLADSLSWTRTSLPLAA